jgi:hypothetical protein
MIVTHDSFTNDAPEDLPIFAYIMLILGADKFSDNFHEARGYCLRTRVYNHVLYLFTQVYVVVTCAYLIALVDIRLDKMPGEEKAMAYSALSIGLVINFI